jgi:hypothetical protein
MIQPFYRNPPGIKKIAGQAVVSGKKSLTRIALIPRIEMR